ncbi:V-type ATP synthase subunit I [Porphyromonas pogonae]|nr:V-type ATPase 116kDa subunit family protein [Porphyromonas pogonae]
MNKYSFVIFHKEYHDFLLKLRSLGVVHIQESKNPKEIKELQDLLNLRKEITQVRHNVASFGTDVKLEEEKVELSDDFTEEIGQKVLAEAKELLDKKNRLDQEFLAKNKEYTDVEVWGDYDVEQVSKLRKAGYVIDFYVTSKSNYSPDWVNEFNAIEVTSDKSQVHFITINKFDDDYERPKADIVKAPVKSLSTLDHEQKVIIEEQKEVVGQLKQFADHKANLLAQYDIYLDNKFSFSNAILQADLQAENALMVLEGWVPEDKALSMENALSQNNYYFHKMEIIEGEKVPIKLKNNKVTKLFEPLTKMFSLPNYYELDPTPLFAPFFMLFFGMCFGDGGYGLFVLVLCTLLKIKAKPDKKPILGLMQWLGGSAFVVGMLMGSFFGVTLGYAKPEDYFLNQNNLMILSLIIGLIQILYGKVLAAIKVKKQKGIKYSLSRFAWVVVILCSLLALAFPKLAPTAPSMIGNVLWGVALAGLLVAYFYNTPGKNIFINFGTGLWDTYNNASGLLGDTLSYIRLFAIGLTGSILGGVFNQLAVVQTESMPILARIPVMLIILVVGHAINFGLAMIGSLVHPLRLTYVEFYKNSEFEGGGNQYEPFRNKKTNN